jgi:excinuclease ABC subunit C
VAPVLKGPEVIARAARILPNKPGVYRMVDDKGTVLYVGKARNLKARVQSYARSGGHTNRIAAMVALTAGMEFVTTETEVEALLLEANLIKRLKPRYNVILRDDKSFPYILIAARAPHRAARQASRRAGRQGQLLRALRLRRRRQPHHQRLQKAFLLRSCSDSVYENRTRPCLLYQIKRCSAPCTGEIAADDYDELVRAAKPSCRGVPRRSSRSLPAPWTRPPSARLRAGRPLPRPHAAMSHVTAQQGINPQTFTEADVFGSPRTAA